MSNYIVDGAVAPLSPVGAKLFGADAAGNVGWMNSVNDDVPVLVIGGDHPYAQWGTPESPGMGQCYLDNGIRPYMAICTDIASGSAPAAAGMLSWAGTKALQGKGVEVVSHGHRHIQAHQRQNTGVQIRYSGANATATVHISVSGANKVLTLTDSSPTAITLTGKTLAQMKVEIEATTGWTCAVASELLGTESAENMLTLVAARTIKTGGVETALNTYFAAGGGLQVSYTGTTHRHVWMRKRENSAFEIYADGLRIYYADLGQTVNNTLAKVAAGVSATSGLNAKIFDNDVGTRYLLGDESSLNLVSMLYLPMTFTPALVGAGLPLWYMVDRQFQKSQDVAASSGVVIKDYAQSGGEIYPWTVYGHRQYGMHRISEWPGSTPISPSAEPLSNGADMWMAHKCISPRDDATEPYTKDRLKAIIHALADSPGWTLNVLCHGLVPDGTGATQYPSMSLEASDMDAYAEDWLAMIQLAKQYMDAEKLQNWTHRDMYLYRNKKKKPRNLIFNPRWKNSGESLLVSTVNRGLIIPGWSIVANNSFASDFTIIDGVVDVTSTVASVGSSILEADVFLIPGNRYRIGCLVELSGIHSTDTNSGIAVTLSSVNNNFAWGGTDKQVSVVLRNSSFRSAAQAIDRRLGEFVLDFAIPEFNNFIPPQVVSPSALTTVDLSTNKNIKLEIASKGVIDNLDCSAGATSASAVTPEEICTAINNALRKDSRYGAQFSSVANAEAGKIVLTAPYAHQNMSPAEGRTLNISAATNNSAFITIFGANTYSGASGHLGQFVAGTVPLRLNIRVGYGRTKISNMYLAEHVSNSVE